MSNNELDNLTVEMESSVEGIKETSYEELMKENTERHPKRNNILQKSKAWYIACTHYLTAGFAIPFIAILIYKFLIVPFLSINSIIINASILWVVWFIGIVLGTLYSSGYLYRTYIVNNEMRKKVIKLSTIYFIVLAGIFRIKLFLTEGLSTFMIMDLIFYILLVVIFYFFSKKYIKTNS